jgi:hypothetical protein
LDFKFPISFIAIEPARRPRSEAPIERKEFERTIAPGEIGEGEHGEREDWFHAQRAYPLAEIPSARWSTPTRNWRAKKQRCVCAQ